MMKINGYSARIVETGSRNITVLDHPGGGCAPATDFEVITISEIERLTAENERLRASIKSIADRHAKVGDMEYADVIGDAMMVCQQQQLKA